MNMNHSRFNEIIGPPIGLQAIYADNDNIEHL